MNDNLKVPKIIHQTAPRDKSKWPKTWYICQNTWFKHFPKNEYKYMMWYDEDLDLFIKTQYNWFYPHYKSYKNKISRIDAARYFILYHYGGIYADMDFYCVHNFYNKLEYNKVSIVESPYKKNEYLQNSLMASSIKHPFWKTVFSQLLINKKKNKILDIAGPRLLDDSYIKEYVNILPYQLFNPRLEDKEVFNSNNIYTKHYLTNVWTTSGHYGISNIRDNLFIKNGNYYYDKYPITKSPFSIH